MKPKIDTHYDGRLIVRIKDIEIDILADEDGITTTIYEVAPDDTRTVLDEVWHDWARYQHVARKRS